MVLARKADGRTNILGKGSTVDHRDHSTVSVFAKKIAKPFVCDCDHTFHLSFLYPETTTVAFFESIIALPFVVPSAFSHVESGRCGSFRQSRPSGIDLSPNVLGTEADSQRHHSTPSIVTDTPFGRVRKITLVHHPVLILG